MLKIIIIVIVIIVLILAAYEPSSIFISKKLTQKYEKDYVLLDETAHVSSEHYTLENISGSYEDYNSYYV
jgi:flagellar basal body-associated protein FliL